MGKSWACAVTLRPRYRIFWRPSHSGTDFEVEPRERQEEEEKGGELEQAMAHLVGEGERIPLLFKRSERNQIGGKRD